MANFRYGLPQLCEKVETAVAQVEGVTRARVLFATEKLVVDTPNRSVTSHIEQAVKKAGYTLTEAGSPSAKSDKPSRFKDYLFPVALAVMILVSWGIESFSPVYGRLAFILTTLVGLFPIGLQAIRLTRSGTPFAIETLMSISAIGALFIGATEEAAMVLMLFMIGELLESYAANRARQGFPP